MRENTPSAVWYSDARRGYENGFAIDPDFMDGEAGTTSEFRKMNFALLKGEALPSGALAKSLAVNRRFREYDRRKLAPITVNDGLFFINEAVKQVLDQFDMGSNRIEPVKLLKSDRKTEIPGSYFQCHFTEKKEAFEPDQSNPKVFKRPRFGDESWLGSVRAGLTSDDDIAVHENALLGAYLWIDRRANKSLFFSDRLHQTLKSQGLLKKTRAFRCRIVSP